MDALPKFTARKNVSLFKKYGVLSPEELESREEVKVEQYFININIEGETAARMARTMILPAAVRYLNEICTTATNASTAGVKSAGLSSEAKRLGEKVEELTKRLAKLDKQNAELGGDDVHSKAKHVHKNVIPAMGAVRETCDELERLIPDDLWPLPTYQEMLFVK